MGGERVADAAKNGELVGALGQIGQVLAEFDARNVGFDVVELAADLRGGVGLEVERVHVGWTAGEIDEDGGFGLGGLDFAGGGEAEVNRQADAGAEGADAEEIAAFDTVTGEGEGHESRPWW